MKNKQMRSIQFVSVLFFVLLLCIVLPEIIISQPFTDEQSETITGQLDDTIIIRRSLSVVELKKLNIAAIVGELNIIMKDFNEVLKKLKEENPDEYKSLDLDLRYKGLKQINISDINIIMSGDGEKGGRLPFQSTVDKLKTDLKEYDSFAGKKFNVEISFSSIMKYRKVDNNIFSRHLNPDELKYVRVTSERSMFKKEPPMKYGDTCEVCPRENCNNCSSCTIKDNECDCNCNYCTRPGNTLDKMWDRNFSMPCGRHDCCYTYGKRTYNLPRGKNSCDAIFAEELMRSCNKQYGKNTRKMAVCYLTADIMYHAVNKFGDDAYIKDQKCINDYLKALRNR